MNSISFAALLVTYFFVALVVVLCCWPLDVGRRARVPLLILSVVGLLASVALGSTVAPGQNLAMFFVEAITTLSRTHVVAIAFGACLAVPFVLLWRGDGEPGLPRTISQGLVGLAFIGTLLTGGLIAGKDVLSRYLPHPDSGRGGSIGRLVDPGFEIQNVMETEIIPVRVAVSPGGKVYVSGHVGIAAQSGAVVEIVENSDGTYQEKLVAPMLNRPYGLIAQDDRIFVSRSGQFARWKNGKAEQVATGAVTMLKDLDGDGVMDYYHDVVTGMPGAQGPDFLHQNNDIAMGPDGALYITNPFTSDALPARLPWEGVLLRASGEDFSNIEEFATGLRNPFDILILP